VISVTHFAAADAGFQQRAHDALAVRARRPGFVRGELGRSTDDTAAWVLVTEWDDVGSYRRALGNYEVKLHATALLAAAIDLPASFETLVAVDRGQDLTQYPSDHA
jgi:heme oxygenase (mycobilin-producing)